MVEDRNRVDEAAITVIAHSADLPLAEGRAAVIAKPLAAWLADANELSRKMSKAKYLDLMPASVFTHLPS